MAVTNETSPEYKKVTDPRTNGYLDATYFRDIQVIPFTFTQSAAAGDAASTMDLVILQKGRYVILPRLSQVHWDAFGASRVLDIGHAAYTNEAGATVAANTNRFDDDINVSSAGKAAMGSSLAIADAAGISINVGGVSDTDGFIVRATVAGGTIPAATKIWGYLVVATLGVC
jgi:hypothetical protein